MIDELSIRLRGSVEPHRRESFLKRWFLFEGNRMHVAGLLLVSVFVVLLLLGAIWPVGYVNLIAETTEVQTIFNTLLGGVILLVSIVVAVASIGITQEITSLGDQSERVAMSLDYREEIEHRHATETSPGRPGQIIVALVRTIQRESHALETIASEHPDAAFVDEIEALTADIDANIGELLTTLKHAKAGDTSELLVGLDYDCSWQLHQAFRLRQTCGDELSEDELATLDNLITTLQEFMTGREYFKTLYYKREFSNLSTMLLVVSLPVIIFVTYVLLALNSGIFPEMTVAGVSPLAIFISFAYTVALAPYIVLTAYVLRAASITKRTPAIGPFIISAHRQPSFDIDLLQRELEP